MATAVVADADTLFGATTRGLLIHLDYQGVIHLHWSQLILDEMSRALVDSNRKPNLKSARRHETLMRMSLPNAEVPVHEVQRQFSAVAPAVRSAKDTHVAACAYVLVADRHYPERVVSLVTNNVRDYGIQKLMSLGIDVQRPDAFLFDLFEQQPQGMAQAFRALRTGLRSAPTPRQLLEKLVLDGQVKTAAAMSAAAEADDVEL
jgi:hypothetical protein